MSSFPFSFLIYFSLTCYIQKGQMFGWEGGRGRCGRCWLGYSFPLYTSFLWAHMFAFCQHHWVCLTFLVLFRKKLKIHNLSHHFVTLLQTAYGLPLPFTVPKTLHQKGVSHPMTVCLLPLLCFSLLFLPYSAFTTCCYLSTFHFLARTEVPREQELCCVCSLLNHQCLGRHLTHNRNSINIGCGE